MHCCILKPFKHIGRVDFPNFAAGIAAKPEGSFERGRLMKAYLVFADGDVLEGEAFGATGRSIGEVVFNTSMTGYQEILTDPSYCGQIVTMTYPLMGNYGVNPSDNEAKDSFVRGFVVREWCPHPSNFRCEGGLDAYLKEHDIIGICGVDTRRITRKVRTHGVMNGAIVTGELDKDALLREIAEYRVSGAVERVTCERPYVVESGSRSIYNVGLYDFGFKKSILENLTSRGCKVTVLPASTPAKEALAMGFDGVMLSNGPGDPADNVQIIAELKTLAASGIPIFGICLGHQLLALSQGAKSGRLAFGHRGGNHPVKDLATGKTCMTSQNHGYAILADSVEGLDATVSHINMNDGTVEGIAYSKINAFSVQFHPEAGPGPHDTDALFDRFIARMEK
jgi:carbamoyl-phosphate synthase small subunit